MLIKKYNCIFFHSGKTAGTAIELMLTGKTLDHKKFNTDYIWGHNGEIMTQHATAKSLRELMDFCSYPREVWDNAFKFTAARNPYDRIVSVYYYLFDFHQKKYGTFEAFVMQLPDIVQTGNNPKGCHYLPQYDYAYIDGEKVTDHIVRFENIDADIEPVRQRLGIERELTRYNTVTSEQRPDCPSAELFTQEMLQIVNKFYAKDFAVFGYDMIT